MNPLWQEIRSFHSGRLSSSSNKDRSGNPITVSCLKSFKELRKGLNERETQKTCVKVSYLKSMLVSLLFRVQSLSDVITNIKVLYVMTVKSITDLFIFAGCNTRETMYRFSEFCSQLWYRLASQSKRQWKHVYQEGTKTLLRTGGHKRSFTKLDLAINMSLLLLFFLK